MHHVWQNLSGAEGDIDGIEAPEQTCAMDSLLPNDCGQCCLHSVAIADSGKTWKQRQRIPGRWVAVLEGTCISAMTMLRHDTTPSCVGMLQEGNFH